MSATIWAETSGKEHPFLEIPWKVTEIESSFFYDEKTFTVDRTFDKQNDQVVTFENDVSERLRVSTTKHPASIVKLGVAASRGEQMPPVWFERAPGLPLPFTKKFLGGNFFMDEEDH